MQKIRIDMDLGNNLRRMRLENDFTQDRLVAQLNLMGVIYPEQFIHGMKPVNLMCRSAYLWRCIVYMAVRMTNFLKIWTLRFQDNAAMIFPA